MIDGLIAGKMHGAAEEREGRNGRPFVTARVRAAVDGGESLFVSVVAFGDTARAALLALGDGDSVALAGQLTPKAWLDREGQPRAGVDLVANAIVTAYNARRRRDAVQRKGDVAPAGGDPWDGDA